MKAKSLLEGEDYQGLSDRARDFVGRRQCSLSKLCECSRGAHDVSDWYVGKSAPTYEQSLASLGEGDAAKAGLTLEDFGYVELPDFRPARLLRWHRKPAATGGAQ